MGLVTIIHGLNPACVYIGGEITAAWDLIEPEMRCVLAERALTEEAARTVIRTSAIEHPRLHGAAALVVAPTFAAPGITGWASEAALECSRAGLRTWGIGKQLSNRQATGTASFDPGSWRARRLPCYAVPHSHLGASATRRQS